MLCGLFAALFGVWALSSPEQRADLLTGVAAVGGVVLSLMRALLSAQQQRPPAPPPPPHANGRDPDPLEDVDEMRLHRVAPVVAVVLAGALAGCGPSALATHARVYAFAAVTLEASQASLVAACTSARDACSGDAACLADAEGECRAAALAQDATRDAVATYEGVIRAAALADSGDVMGSLMVALSLAASAWASLGARLGDVGIALPALPAWVSGAIGGAQ
ncbi:MAG: hypothetical protein IPK80_02780 [Nannocystis sp.]|nr:hypothetical protein [Nannocystis sp.]